MNYLISQNVPICPDCSGLMLRRHQALDTYYCCNDCMKILKVIGTGKAEIELIVTDGKQSDPHEMTHREKFCKLFDELGIEYNVTEGGNIQLDSFYVDGAADFYVDFWDGEYYPDGEFKEFIVFSDAGK